MPARSVLSRKPGQLRKFAAVVACALMLATGCKTSQDAVAAATQMSATAKSLSDYYSALNTILADTDQIYSLNEQLFSKPYTAENRQLLKNNEAELAKRAAVAADFSTLAGSFAGLTGTAASADILTSATKLQMEIDTLAKVKVSTSEQNGIKSALQIFIVAIQEHKEREAAKAIGSIAKGLTDLFLKEAPIWNSTDEVYTQVASVLADNLVDQNGVDNAALLNVALSPFGLTPAAPTGDLAARLAPLAKQQIATRKAALDASYVSATDAMTKSLQEMSQRIDLVAEDKPMAFRAPPLTVATVEQWAVQVASY